ncbi:Uncharacterised protein [Legionella busanensis]|uniref:DUF4153 domain-containing protein n=1 Tax=Legionella busanensis TaxID=190655 RepID=A0A378JK07_9GAMM|nr:DUF4153 domain-containing protein [Legionella busanensis]STX51018.1 Uncharacterised protein [Legionella busanensis]
MKQLFLTTATVRCMIGLIQGTILYFLFAVSQNKIQWLVLNPYIFLPMLMITIFVPLLIIQGLASLRFKTISMVSLLITLVIIRIADYAVYRQILPNYDGLPLTSMIFSMQLFFLTSIVLFITQSLVLSSEQDQRLVANYATYFNMAWKLGVQIIFTIVFVGAFWLLLALGSTLFHLIHLTFFEYLITQAYFAMPATTFIIAIALHITDVNVRVTQGIRALCLTLLSWLLPLIAGIISLFLISLFFTGLSPLWHTGHASALLLLAAVVLIILINAVYREGAYDNKSLFSIQNWAATLSCYLLIPLISLAIYALYLRVQQYGLSVDRIYAAVCMVIGSTYAVGYTLSALFSKNRFVFFAYCNIATAFLILIIYLALHTPLADPVRLSVANQLLRLQTGKVTPEKFDFAALRYKGLRFGQQALLELQNTWQGPQREYVRIHATEAFKLKLKAYPNSGEKPNPLIIHTANGKLPSSFLNQHWLAMEGSINIPFCLSNGMGKCDVWQMQDLQKNPLILILENGTFTGFKKTTSGQWTAIGYWLIPYKCSEKIRKAAVAGEFKLVLPPPSNQDIEVMGVSMSFNQKIDNNICNN